MQAKEDEWLTIEYKLGTEEESTVKLPSGKKVPQLTIEARECTICETDGEHQIPFWCMAKFHACIADQKKRTGWIEVEYCRSILPDGNNKVDFRLE